MCYSFIRRVHHLALSLHCPCCVTQQLANISFSTMFANPFQFKPIGYKYQPYSKSSFFHVYRNTRRKTYIHVHIKCVWFENSVVLECNFFRFFCVLFFSLFLFSIVFELELAGRFESYVFPTPFMHENTCEHTAQNGTALHSTQCVKKHREWTKCLRYRQYAQPPSTKTY